VEFLANHNSTKSKSLNCSYIYTKLCNWLHSAHS